MIFNKRVCIIFLACVVIIAGAVFGWRSHQALNVTGGERARLLAQVTALKARLQSTEQDLAQAKADWKDEQSATTPKELAAMDAAQGVRFNAFMDAFKELLKTDSNFRKIYYDGLQNSLKTSYGAFLAKEHLTPGQTDKLMKAILQHRMDQDDLEAALKDQGLSTDDPSGLVIKQQSDDAFQQAVEDTIGPDGYAQLKTYGPESAVRYMVGSCAVQSAFIGSPMTSGQVGQMVDYIAQNYPDFQFQKGNAISNAQINWDAVDDQARKIMTPEQYDIFTHANSTRWNQKIDQAINAIVTGSKQTSDAAPAQ